MQSELEDEGEEDDGQLGYDLEDNPRHALPGERPLLEGVKDFERNQPAEPREDMRGTSVGGVAPYIAEEKKRRTQAVGRAGELKGGAAHPPAVVDLLKYPYTNNKTEESELSRYAREFSMLT